MQKASYKRDRGFEIGAAENKSNNSVQSQTRTRNRGIRIPTRTRWLVGHATF